MTGTAKVKPPKNNAEWARNTQKRLEQVEHPTSTRVGEWVLSTQADTGNLIASHVDGGSVILAVKPEPSADADVVESTGLPFIRLERQQNQNEPRGTALVLWDTVSYQTDEWSFVPEATDVVIPEDGLYYVHYHLALGDDIPVVTKAMLFIDGTVKMAQEFQPHVDDPWYQSMYMAEPFPLSAGQVITCGAYMAGSGTFDFGPSAADPEVYTSMSLVKLDVD